MQEVETSNIFKSSVQPLYFESYRTEKLIESQREQKRRMVGSINSVYLCVEWISGVYVYECIEFDNEQIYPKKTAIRTQNKIDEQQATLNSIRCMDNVEKQQNRNENISDCVRRKKFE